MKSDAMTLREALGFQLLLDGCKHEVMIAANVGTWERPCVCFFMPDLKRWVVIMKSIWLSTCPSGPCQVAVLDNLWGWRVLARVSWWHLCKLLESPSSVICLSNAKSSCCPCPVFVCVRIYCGVPIALNYKYILLGSLCYDTIKLLVELFNLLIFVV